MSTDVLADVGIGVRGLSGPGEVIASYSRAAYVRCAGGLFALTRDAEPGPIHVRCAELPAVTVGERVRVDATSVTAWTWTVDLRVPTWRGTLPDPDALAAADLDVPPARLLTGPLPAAWPAYADVIGAGDLRLAARTLGGRGTGLTPAGDDVLAGLLLVATAKWGPDLPMAAVGSAHTNDIAAAFLRWAARGQSIAPVHDLLHAVARHDAAGTSTALIRLRSFGATSGGDLAYGLALGLRHLPRAPP